MIYKHKHQVVHITIPVGDDDKSWVETECQKSQVEDEGSDVSIDETAHKDRNLEQNKLQMLEWVS